MPELRIVEDELWDKAKARQKTMTAAHPGQKGKEFWDKRRPRYLFSGLLTCGVCGAGFSMISKTHLGCSTARNKGTCNNRLMRSREALEAEVLDGLKSRLMQPELFDIFCTEWTKHLNAIQMAKSGHVAALKAELARCRKALDQIADAIVNGVPA